jgi:hypothetical protein
MTLVYLHVYSVRAAAAAAAVEQEARCTIPHIIPGQLKKKKGQFFFHFRSK